MFYLKGKSLRTLKKLIDELVSIFPDRYLHMGSDETGVSDKCTLEGLLVCITVKRVNQDTCIIGASLSEHEL